MTGETNKKNLQGFNDLEGLINLLFDKIIA
jgi:hypothetical protein